MFKEDETQDCSVCQEWVEKYEQKENNFDEIKEERDNLAKDIQYQNRKLVELELTLQEIAKIANQGNTYCLDYNLSDCDICIKQYDCKTMLFKQIIDKIDEVEQWK